MMSLHHRAVPEMQPTASTSPRCELCGSRPLFYCAADQAFLCRACDDRVHAANFIVLRHARTALCHACACDTGLRIQGAGQARQCLDAALGAPVREQVPLCSACCALAHPAKLRQLKRKLAASLALPWGMGPLPLPAKASSLRHSCTSHEPAMAPAPHAATFLEADSRAHKRRRDAAAGPSHAAGSAQTTQDFGWKAAGAAGAPARGMGELDCREQGVPGHAAGLPSLAGCRRSGGAMAPRDTWLRLAVEQEEQQEGEPESAVSGLADSEGPSSSCGISRLHTSASTASLSGQHTQRTAPGQVPAGATAVEPLVFCSPEGDSAQGSSEASSVGSCSAASSMKKPPSAGVGSRSGLHFGPLQKKVVAARRLALSAAHAGAPAYGDLQIVPAQSPSAHPSPADVAPGAPQVCRQDGGVATGPGGPLVPQQGGLALADSAAFESEGPPAPLGRPASSRLQRVLRSWSESLGGVDASTQTLAYELFQRALLRMKRGEVAANFLRVTLAACLWLATKLVELRAHTPGAKEVATVTGVPSAQLTKAEITVLKLLDWQPLKHVGDRFKAQAAAQS